MRGRSASLLFSSLLRANHKTKISINLINCHSSAAWLHYYSIRYMDLWICGRGYGNIKHCQWRKEKRTNTISGIVVKKKNTHSAVIQYKMTWTFEVWISIFFINRYLQSVFSPSTDDTPPMTSHCRPNSTEIQVKKSSRGTGWTGSTLFMWPCINCACICQWTGIYVVFVGVRCVTA